MNHFTVLSDDLEATRRFYCDLFGFKVGWRPPFQFPGWWLYADDDTPILHVIHREDLPQDRGGVLDHMAFSAKDLPGTIATLKREGLDYELRRCLAAVSGSSFSMTRAAPRSSSTSTRTSRPLRVTSRADRRGLLRRPRAKGGETLLRVEHGRALLCCRLQVEVKRGGVVRPIDPEPSGFALRGVVAHEIANQ